jgi:hypothetical protein
MEAEQTFFIWFIENFSALTMEYKLSTKSHLVAEFRDFLVANFKGNSYHQRGCNMVLHDYLSQKWFLNGEASKQYLDYLELKESRLAAVQARKQSNLSIMIAIGAIIISSILGIATLVYQPENAQPPYEVKVIEDRTRTMELEKENKELKEKLIKADTAVKAI